MTIFNLPDLGEGLTEAEIHEWYVKEGDEIQQDMPMVAMETAKAVVDVPAPFTGIIHKCFGTPGSIINTGAPLVEFKSVLGSSTVVGELKETPDMVLKHIHLEKNDIATPKATHAIKRLANQLNVDWQSVIGTGELGMITNEDIKKHAKQNPQTHAQALKGVRRQMALAMELSHRHVVPVTIYDDADITNWNSPYDISVRLIQAICHAVKQEPSLNGWFNDNERALLDDVNLGIAMDSKDGLFVPVITKAQTLDEFQLRAKINELKNQVALRQLSTEQMQHASFTLSNFGKFAGKYASPVVVPPMVAILAVGRLFKEPKFGNQGVIEATKLPLSLTFDHRAITGGEATRFMGELIKALEQS